VEYRWFKSPFKYCENLKKFISVTLHPELRKLYYEKKKSQRTRLLTVALLLHKNNSRPLSRFTKAKACQYCILGPGQK
jgi:hypothetical protein